MNPEQLRQQMADIIVPAPANTTLHDTGILVLIVVLLSLTAWLIRRRSRRPSAQAATTADDAMQQFELLQQDWHERRIDSREAAFRLATVLRLGLNLAQLPLRPPTPAIDKPQWHRTIETLNALRYPPTLTQTLTDDLFSNIRQILLQAAEDG